MEQVEKWTQGLFVKVVMLVLQTLFHSDSILVQLESSQMPLLTFQTFHHVKHVQMDLYALQQQTCCIIR